MQNLKVRWATEDDADFVVETIREVSEGVIDFLLARRSMPFVIFSKPNGPIRSG